MMNLQILADKETMGGSEDSSLSPAEETFADAYHLFLLGHLQDAEAAFRRYGESSPTDLRGYYAIATCLQQREQPHDAAVVLEQGLQCCPPDNAARYFLARLLEQTGDVARSTSILVELAHGMAQFASTRSLDTAHGPQAYLYTDAALERIFRLLIERMPTCNARLLDVGCNNGCILDFYRRRGHRTLAGVEVNPHALAYFESHYAETYALSRIEQGDISAVLPTLPDRCVDVVYTHYVLTNVAFDDTVEHLARIADQHVFLVETDQRNDCLMPSAVFFHDHERIFSKAGFELIDKETGDDPSSYDRIEIRRLFRRRARS